jgi:aryl-alcohol dehydrogenase-like predicted oxidoreductase
MDKTTDNFAYSHLPVVDKQAFRLGLAGNFGIKSDSILWAAERGVNYWLWGASFGKVTNGIRETIKTNREKQIVAYLGWGYFGWQIRKNVEKALRQLKTDYLDVFKLGWLGKTSAYTSGTIDTLLKLKQEGKIKAIGTSIHDRQRAGKLALDSELDLFMIRYSAKHPGAEQDIFPHLTRRNPAVISYTALAWGQLIKPLKNFEMPPWPGQEKLNVPPLTPELCYRFVLNHPSVHVVLTGPKNQKQLEENLAAIQKGPLSEDEMNWIREYGKRVKSRKKLDYV